MEAKSIFDVVRVEGFHVGPDVSAFRGVGDIPLVVTNTSRRWEGGKTHARFVEKTKNIAEGDYVLHDTSLNIRDGNVIANSVRLKPLSSPPSTAEVGSMAMTDGVKWDVNGDGKAGIVVFNGTHWLTMLSLETTF